MQALTVVPGVANSVRLHDVPEPTPRSSDVLIQAHSVGICGTDREIVAGQYGEPPLDEERLILGHESLGRVLEASSGSGVSAGDWVCCIVRRPDPVPCSNCARGEWDMCQNGRYTEHGIKQRHGFAAERYCVDAGFVVPVAGLAENGVLVEPASVVAKAWDHIESIGHRTCWEPRRVLVTGAGPIGLLAALFAVQRGLDVHVLDRVTDGPKPHLVAELGAKYHVGEIEKIGDTDIVLECTGAPALVFPAMRAARRNGIVCLTGVSTGARTMSVDAAALNRTLVLENNVVFGSVNANRRHYEQAANALASADQSWLERLITRRIPIERWPEALSSRAQEAKTVLSFQ